MVIKIIIGSMFIEQVYVYTETNRMKVWWNRGIKYTSEWQFMIKNIHHSKNKQLPWACSWENSDRFIFFVYNTGRKSGLGSTFRKNCLTFSYISFTYFRGLQQREMQSIPHYSTTALSIQTTRTKNPRAIASSTPTIISRKFSRFVCSMVFKSLGRSAASRDAHSQLAFTSHFNTCSEFIHQLTTAVSAIIPLSIIVYALNLVEKVGSESNRKVAVGSESFLFATALIVAQKMCEDRPFANKCWIKVLCMPVVHINLLEREFLASLHFNVAIPVEEYEVWSDYVQESAKTWDKAIDLERRPSQTLRSPPLSPFTSQRS